LALALGFGLVAGAVPSFKAPPESRQSEDGTGAPHEAAITGGAMAGRLALGAPVAQAPITSAITAFVPLAMDRYDPPLTHPNPALAAEAWRALDRLAETVVTPRLFPGYAAGAGGPSAANAAANVDAACHDFPDIPEFAGRGAHHAACYEWVAAYLSLFHAVRARQAALTGRADRGPEVIAADLAWSRAYLDEALDWLEAFVYGPEDRPAEIPADRRTFRDTQAAIWQNPLRGIDIVLVVDLLRKQGAVEPAEQARAEELLSGIARSWYAHYRVAEAGTHPTHGLSLATAAFPRARAVTLAGKQAAAHVSWTVTWDADKGQTPAEEVGWAGTNAMLTARALGPRLEDGATLYEAGRHAVDFTIAFDRPDPVHGGTVRTLNAETRGGAYGQRRYWIENHTADVPSIPYLGYAWLSIGVALYASDLGDQTPWPGLVPDTRQWDVLLRSAGETLRAPDGTFLVDWTPGRGIGYNMDPFPLWRMPCGQGTAGRHYVRYDGRAGGPELWVSEIGHPAGLDLINVGWPVMRLAVHRQDREAYGVWEDRVRRVLAEYAARPPNPRWSECTVAPYVSTNPRYHGTRMMAGFVQAWLGLSGYSADSWE